MKSQYNSDWFRLAYSLFAIHFSDTRHCVWLLGASAQKQKGLTCYFPPFKYSVFLFRPFEWEEYFLPPAIPVVNSWYPLSAREEERQGLCLFCSLESLCNVCKGTGSQKQTNKKPSLLTACAPFSDNLLPCCSKQLVPEDECCILWTQWQGTDLFSSLFIQCLLSPVLQSLRDSCPRSGSCNAQGEGKPDMGILCLTAAPFPSVGEGQRELGTVQISWNCFISCPEKTKHAAVLVDIKAAGWSQTTAQLTRCPLAVSW